MTAYKLFRQRRDGSIGPLFINRRLRVPINSWLVAEYHPTRGYALRPGWHCGALPKAPHLTERGRVWAECEIPDNGFYAFTRPRYQGGEWLIAEAMRVERLLSADDVSEILRGVG